MTFELSPEQDAARERARRFARERLAAAADGIDAQGAIAPDLLRELQTTLAAGEQDPTTLVVSVEELAAVSAAAAAAAALAQTSAATGSATASGLRGLAPPRGTDARGRLIFAAVACGVARAAVEASLTVLRNITPGTHEEERPHWVVADAATETEAARLLTLQAAQALGESSAADGLVAMAKLAATRAAQHAVDAALRIVGAEALTRGSLLERLSRDVRALALMLGSEEDLRAAVAAARLPG